MPYFRPGRASVRLPRSRPALAPSGARLSALGLVALGLGLLAVTGAPMLIGAPSAAAQSFTPKDPGVRGGPPDAGGPLNGLTQAQMNFFTEGQNRFEEVDSVSGTVSGEDGVGLGPRFNMNSCAGCHAQPAVGGSSPALNPQVAMANKDGATNKVPFFITQNGPVREVRFVHNPDGSADGGVHDLFTIAGRSDAPSGCTAALLPQPDFAAQAAANNVVFRIPTPTFGAGLIQTISDDTLLDNLNASTNSSMGVAGHLNREGNAGTVTRFGWKAQNKSTEIFSGEAYLVEQGVSNEVFPQERFEAGDRTGSVNTRASTVCEANSNGTPEDMTNFGGNGKRAAMSDVQGFSVFATLLAAPNRGDVTPSTISDSSLFSQVGCALCHTPMLPTGPSNVAALSNQTIHPYSDFAVHHMGPGLADGVSQGSAGPDEFRTAPLWGLGQRIFLLHDGRTTDLMVAIQQHDAKGNKSSEAHQVIANFNALPGGAQQDILNFLRSL
jgi:CxxC motif-containing protein (DUF1111 family)